MEGARAMARALPIEVMAQHSSISAVALMIKDSAISCCALGLVAIKLLAVLAVE